MALNRNSNGYTFIFAIIMVVVVGAALAIAAMALKKPQTENAVARKMIDILGALQIEAERTDVREKFDVYIKERLVLDSEGNVISTKTGEVNPTDLEDGFNVDVQKQFRDKTIAPEDRLYPIFKAEVDGKPYFVFPMVGKGLWGPIWGYMSLENDINTVAGVTFDHKSETPGLGAEIREKPFQAQFNGKKIYDGESLVSIEVKKGGADPDNPHAVDGITGGTITSNGVDEMLERTLSVYDTYFKKVKNENPSTAEL